MHLICKLIVLSFSCLIIFYARPQDSFHQNQASGHASCFIELPHCGSSTKTLEDFGTLEVVSSHLWGHSLQKDILQNTLQGTELQNNPNWLKFVPAILTSSQLLRSVQQQVIEPHKLLPHQLPTDFVPKFLLTTDHAHASAMTSVP